MINLKKFLFSVSPAGNTVSWALLILRIAIALLMVTQHGWSKWMNFETLSKEFPDPIGFGSEFALILVLFAEIGCSLLLAIGVFSRLATVPLVINMSVALLIAHSGDAFQAKELPLLFLLIYIVLLIAGPGRFSLDDQMHKKRKR
ncbi:MAG: DoxX family protein [Candidatus Azobacteroides sp.]|nr:DoxX family protein [Candidatus Azobacteroides sp.]